MGEEILVISWQHNCYYTKMFSFFKHSPYAPFPTEEAVKSLRGFGTAGEMLSLSFSLSASEGIAELELTGSDLESTEASLPKSCVSLFIVKVWEQAGIGVYQSTPARVAELLLKDDRAQLGDSYSRRGQCGHWKHLLRASQLYRPPDVRLEGNAHTTLDSNEAKQIWVTIKIPADSVPGHYRGYLEVKSKEPKHANQRLRLELEVLPIKLVEPEQDLFIWYKGTLDCNRPQHYVRPEVFRAQLQDIYSHGFRSISLNEVKPSLLQQALNIANSIGFNRHVLLTAPHPESFTQIDFKNLRPVYYISDELDTRPESFIRDHIENWNKIKTAGGRTMSSLLRRTFASRFSDPDDIGFAPDLISYYLPTNLNYFLAHSEFEPLQKDRSYYYWHSHMEKPDVHRVLAGLYLWKSKAAGIAPYCYQHLPKAPFSPFDDFDEWEPDFHVGSLRRPFKDHMTTYPARFGSIPTLQWKGMADGIYDLRYLTTFEAALKRFKDCRPHEGGPFVEAARLRCEQFLKRISLKDVNINSETISVPYRHIMPEEYSVFREQLARDIMTIAELTGTMCG